MKFPTLSRTKPTAPLNMETDPPTSAIIPSSQHTSTSRIEKERTLFRASPGQHSEHEDEKRVVETTPLDKAEALDKLSDEPEYPSGAKLAIVIASLCLSVFLMALVSPLLTHGQWVEY